MKLRICSPLAAIVAGTGLLAQQVADTAFQPPIPKPAYTERAGPVVLIDEAHHNFHTATGRYQPLADLLRRDGHVVRPSTSKFSRDSLRSGKILVVSSALSEQQGRSEGDWLRLPTPSAFSDEEVGAVRDWVREGGSLLLIADHMPFAGATMALAAAFGVHWANGYAFDQRTLGREDFDGTLVFRRPDGSLADHAIVRGRFASERVDAVVTFTGSAFQGGKELRPLLILGESIASFTPSEWKPATEATPHVPVAGWYQGATLRFGKGRAAFFGEAAMFSAQLTGPERRPFGMNAPVAWQNPQFVLNLFHWLSNRLPREY